MLSRRSLVGLAVAGIGACSAPADRVEGGPCGGHFWLLANGHVLETSIGASEDGTLSGTLREGETVTSARGSCEVVEAGEPGALHFVRTDGERLRQQYDGTYGVDPASGQVTMQGTFVDDDAPERPFFAFTPLDDTEVTTTSAEQLGALRRRLYRLLWGRDDLPPDLDVTTVETDVASPLVALGPELARVDLWTVEMTESFRSSVYRFLPARPAGRLMAFHQGHSDDLGASNGDATVRFLLERGVEVLALYMPAQGPNENPIGPSRDHSFLRFGPAPTASGHRLRYFVEPVVAALDRALSESSPALVGMIGISGGGWTTVLAAALDPRIDVAIAVADSLPSHLRRAQDVGDWEQFEPDLYRVAGYPDLYALAAGGEGRRFVQVHNERDPCCFAGSDVPDYVADVRRALEGIGLGGRFDFEIDAGQTEHTISERTLAEIVEPVVRP